jgi:hypothetical protein
MGAPQNQLALWEFRRRVFGCACAGHGRKYRDAFTITFQLKKEEEEPILRFSPNTVPATRYVIVLSVWGADPGL